MVAIAMAAAMPCAPSPFLAIPLRLSAVDLATPLGLVRAEPRIGVLHYHVLVHQADVDLVLKNLRGQVNRADLLALHIQHWNIHDFSLRLL
jgi:hypothetical protein